jgi:hypothetical protein
MPIDPPAPYKIAANAQIVSGFINVLFMGALVAIVFSGVFGTIGVTCGSMLIAVACPAGLLGWMMPLCGLWGLMLMPLGFVEIIVGFYALTEPTKSGSLVRMTAILELVGIVFGGLPSAIVGACVLSLMSNPEVVLFLEAHKEAPRQ